jgi:Pyruvate/2-oxoacid:ferredoxin oxidoreductase delta subunit
MEVDPNEPETASLWQALGLKVLSLESYGFDTTLSVLVCTECEAGVHPKVPVAHAQSHGIKLTKAQIDSLNNAIHFLNLASDTKDLPTRAAYKAPVDYIKIQSGLACKACVYFCPTSHTLESHWTDCHSTLGRAEWSDCQVQTIFARQPNFFAVLPILKGLATDDKYRLYISQFSAEISKGDSSLAPAVSDHEVPPLLRVTLWHEHLAEIIKEKISVRATRLLVDTQHGTKKHAHLDKPLSSLIEDYMLEIKKRMKQVPIPVRMLLMQYPV